MPEYHLEWEIDLTADSPLEAAKEALAVQRDLNAITSVFTVTDEDGNVTVVDAVD